MLFQMIKVVNGIQEKLMLKELLEKLMEFLLQTLWLFSQIQITPNKKLLHITEISILVVSNEY